MAGPDPSPTVRVEASVRPMREADLPAADRIFRVAFGTFLGLERPETFFGDTDYVRTRWKADPEAAFAAERDGELVASNFAARWGSVAFFGPLTVRPDLWDRGIAKRLLEPTVALFRRWEVRHAGLFTFAHSAKHVALYQRFGFWPRFLTAVMSKLVRRHPTRVSRLSEAHASARAGPLAACREVTSSIFEGLDVTREVLAVLDQSLGDVVLLHSGSKLAGFGVCHVGAGTEAGSGVCYVKFGAVRPGTSAGQEFERLLDACEEFAASRGADRLVAGVNTARQDAYARMIARGFRTEMQGVAMETSDGPGYNRADVHVLDDWR